MTSLASAVRTSLLSAPEVSRLASLRRSTSLFSQGQTADAVYFIEDGLVKLTRTNDRGGHIILSICGPGHLIGEEALTTDTQIYYTEAEVLSTSNIYRIPRETLVQAVSGNPELSNALVSYLLHRKLALAMKVELLCLHDVEYRILHYLAELSALVKPLEDGDGYQVPITQLELADLIGATRETTSTTLNQLERRGLVKLSRRLLTIPSPVTLRNAASGKTEQESGAVARSI
ncbi:MAG TPA: Crp/Fnr family transcriptional regulator [Bryobacteraceae bacterium]|nr:Crp/Fnr family transcriptional regulator [Bryobacteraceae bacterium]